MALRALTPSGAAYCSECGADALEGGDRCTSCKRPFEGVLEAVRCPFCGAILFRNASECYHCGRKVPAAEIEASEESYFAKHLDSTRQAAVAGHPPAQPIRAAGQRRLVEGTQGGFRKGTRREGTREGGDQGAGGGVDPGGGRFPVHARWAPREGAGPRRPRGPPVRDDQGDRGP